MASINDLATAATIASSAVALQSSPSQQASQHAQSSPPAPVHLSLSSTAATPLPPPPTTPSASSTALTASETNPWAPTTTATTASTAANSANSAPGPSVLAAPQISPQNPAQAQIPAPVTPTAAAAAGAGVGAALAAAAAQAAGKNSFVANEAGSFDDSMDGVEMSLPKPVRGAFLVFEGMDRAGKTTQAKLLQQRCIESGREIKFMRFPDRATPIGQMIDSYLKGDTEIEDHVIHLLFSANRWEAVKKIKAELEAGHTIICDRFYHSGIVYSAAKQLPSLSLSWAKAPEVGLPRPDMVLFLDLEESVARKRGGWGGEVYEKGEMQRRVRELFWGLSMGDLGSAVSNNNNNNSNGGSNNNSGSNNSGSNGKGLGSRRESERFLGNVTRAVPGGEAGEFRQEEEDIQIVDADLGVEELSEKVWEVVLPRLRAVERGEVGRMVRVVR
ncbi:thymidylate kinase-domain-containing protein [Biscogniauxia marginata]|nr:thymidylate kinase-domain-containing protein [Biscogniauxia marginata]